LGWRGCFKCPLFISKKKDYRCRKNNQSSLIQQAKNNNQPCENVISLGNVLRYQIFVVSLHRPKRYEYAY
jgi:hypothetical protein